MNNGIIDFIFNYGVPTAITFYLLYLIDHRLLEWSSIVTKQITTLFERDKKFDERMSRLERKMDDVLRTLRLTKREDDPK